MLCLNYGRMGTMALSEMAHLLFNCYKSLCEALWQEAAYWELVRDFEKLFAPAFWRTTKYKPYSTNWRSTIRWSRRIAGTIKDHRCLDACPYAYQYYRLSLKQSYWNWCSGWPLVRGSDAWSPRRNLTTIPRKDAPNSDQKLTLILVQRMVLWD